MKAIVIHQAGDAQQLQIEVLMPKRLPSYLLILTSTMYRLLPKKYMLKAVQVMVRWWCALANLLIIYIFAMNKLL